MARTNEQDNKLEEEESDVYCIVPKKRELQHMEKTQSLFGSPKISDFHHHTMAPSDHTKINKLGLKRRTRSNKSSIANGGKICSNLELIPCLEDRQSGDFFKSISLWFTWHHLVHLALSSTRNPRSNSCASFLFPFLCLL